MSDDQQTPEEETPQDAEGETADESPEEPQDGADSETPPAEAEAAESAGETEEPAADDDAAAALAAAQAAVAAALNEESSDDGGGDDEPTPEELEMLAAMQQAVNESTGEAAAAASGGEEPVSFEPPAFKPAPPAADEAELEMLGDVDMDVRIELGRTRMLVEDVLRLGEGAVVELEKLAGDPVDVFVNGRLVARGEVLVLNENFCVRVNEVVEPLPVSQKSD